MSAFKSVVHAADKKSIKPVLTGIFVGASEDGIDVVATDGLTMAWDKVHAVDNGRIDATIPKAAVEKILSLGILDDVQIYSNAASIIFQTSEFTVSSRLIDGKYLDFKRFFAMIPSSFADIEKKELTEAMNRAKLSMVDASGNRKPAVVRITQDQMEISIASAIGDYKEDLGVQSNIQNLVIGLNPVVVLDSIKPFGEGRIRLKFANCKSPVFMEQEESGFRSMCLPVAINVPQEVKAD
jgi:DNA polymerase-3 subunit beta